MKQFLYMLVLLTIVSITGFAQNNYRVIDEHTKQGIPFANIYFPDTKTGTQTDSSGNFSIKGNTDLPVLVSAIGYKTILTKLQPVILLSASHTDLQEVIVSGTSSKLQGENVQNITSLKLSSQQVIAAMSLAEKLASVSGVSQVSTGNGIGKPVIRGLSGNRVAVFTQGVRVENQQWGDEHGLGLSENGYENVEIIKGPASLLYGSDAIGGVIYFVDERYAKDNFIETHLQSKYSSNTDGWDNRISFKLSKNKFHFNAFGSYNTNKDYRDGSGFHVPNSRFNTADIKTAVAYTGHNYTTALRYNYLKENYGITEVDSTVLANYKDGRNPGFVKQPLTTHIVSWDNTVFLKNSKLKFVIGHVYNRRLEVEGDSVGNPETALGLQVNSTSWNVRWYSATKKQWSFIAGSQGMYQYNKNTGAEILVPDGSTFDLGVFANSTFNFSSQSFWQMGLRFDNRSINTKQNSLPGDEDYKPAFKNNYQSINFSTGVYHKITGDISLRANIASGFRAPNTFELLSNGVHEGTYRYEIGSTSLESENSYQADAELSYTNEHIDLSINPFYNYVRNYIYLSPADSTIDDLPVYYYQQSNAGLFGGEASIHFHPHPLDWLHAEASYNAVFGRANNADLPLIPAQKIITTLRVDIKSDKRVAVRNAFIQNNFSFAQNRTAPFETPTPSYNLLNAGAGLSIKNGRQDIVINAGISNIFNKKYFDHLSRLKTEGIYNAGRNIYISISVPVEGRMK